MGEHELGAADVDAAEYRAARATVWRALAGLGALRLAIPIVAGGEGAGLGCLIVVAELMGRHLYQSPFFDTVTAADLMLAAGGPRQPWLERIAAGDCAIALAWRDGGRQRTSDWAELEASPLDRSGTRRLRATRRFVPFAREVDGLLLAGRTAEGPSLALVPCGRPNLVIRRQDEITRGDLCAVQFEGTAVHADEWVEPPGQAAGIWAATMPSRQVRHAAYLVGLAQGSFDGALRYAKERRQFGQPIARLQSIGFRLAALATRIEAARHLAHFAAWRIDQGEDSRLTAVQALAMAGDLARDTSTQAVQIHGAYGMTERSDAQRYYRRATLDALWFGAPSELRSQSVRWLAERAEWPANAPGGERR
jgi:alkylation response protein AidB-like acyl-CoA dehydrogenase